MAKVPVPGPQPSLAAGDRPSQRRLELLGWELVNKGPLIGRAKVRLPNQLEIADISVFEKNGRRWTQLPAEICATRRVSRLWTSAVGLAIDRPSSGRPGSCRTGLVGS